MYEEYLYPLIRDAGASKILDVGCGTGGGVATLVEQKGIDAYGIDLPFEMRHWKSFQRDPSRFFAADATKLPFGDAEFDFVISTGVIEHIGTTDGKETLANGFKEGRATYVNELLRVVKPQGRLVIACPNKTFPIDLQHNPPEDARLRTAIHRRTGMNFHPTWGRYHLVSYSEIRELLRGQKYEALPLRRYFGFSAFRNPFLRPLLVLAQAYIDHLPRFLRKTALNPYMLIMVTKASA